MASKVDIYNLTLAHIGLPAIEATTDNSKEADAINRVYNQLLEEVLEEADWSFARITVALAEHTVDPPGDWAYRYGYPPDCIRARELVVANSRRMDAPLPFSIELLPDGSDKTILSDTAAAELRYTTLITNTTFFDSLFVGTFSWRIAVEIALPLTKKREMWQAATAQYQLLKVRAITQNDNQGYSGPKAKPGALKARS